MVNWNTFKNSSSDKERSRKRRGNGWRTSTLRCDRNSGESSTTNLSSVDVFFRSLFASGGSDNEYKSKVEVNPTHFESDHRFYRGDVNVIFRLFGCLFDVDFSMREDNEFFIHIGLIVLALVAIDFVGAVVSLSEVLVRSRF
jgi:hypothetical protein